jgi:hypothetical protein
MFDIFYSGKKPGLFAHERAADSIEHAQSLSRTRFFWWVSYLCDYSSWDWFYEPPPWQAHQNHVWPSKWHQYSGTCLISKAPTDQWNFHDEVIATRCVDENWRVLHAINLAQFDFSWHPHPLDPPYIYVWGNQHWPGEKMPTVEYVVDNATERKYMDWPASLLPTATNWTIPVEIDPTSVDYSWVPDPQDPAYIYEFATQWQPNGGAVYTVPGATERKYVEIQHCRLPNKTAFTKLEVVQGFDYSWHPDNTEPPYNYVFGNQHWAGTEMPTLVYAMSGATQEKFVDNVVACLASTMGNWEFGEDIDQAVWDWTWVPNPKDPPFIYVFGNQWNPPEFKASITYRVPGATEVKYMERRTTRLPQPAQFRHNIAVSKFDYSWEPNPFDPPMIYVFGNQWNSAVLEPTVIYNAGGDQIKYVDDIIATVAQDVSAWELLDDIEEFDYSWRPNPTDPPYTYVFGNQWLTPEQRPALQYAVTGATQIKYMEHPQARRRGDHTRFIQHYPVSFDWSWEPDPGSPPYNYVFGNQYYSAEVMPTVEYRMPGATVHKYMDIAAQLLPCHDNHWHTIIDCEWDYTWRPEPGSPAYIYVFGNQWWSAEKMPTVEYHMPGATERKYMPGPVAKLLVDMSKWTIPEYVDTTDMDFSWAPDPGEPAYIYQFATQHQKTGGPQYRMPGATEFKYVDMMRAEVKKEAAPVFEIDHLDGAAGQIPNTVKRVRYFDNYRDTLIRLAKSLVGEYEHVWVCSSICDYGNFDFTWHPETWQSTMLHVFASDKEKFGDTFYMHVPTFAERAEKKALLEWYSVNYVPRKSVPRRPMPVIRHNDATHVEQVKTAQWSGPLALFTINDATVEQPIVSLWRQETKNIVPVGTGASAVVVPRIAVPYIKTQLYDYPTIDKKSHRWQKVDQPMDIVFISYDEPDAEQNWQILSDRFPRAHRVHGVKGMETALETAANVAQTPWYFAVFAKTRLHETFDFSFVPDYMQQPKHYIFDCLNQSNQLQYGHMGVVMYNCNGVRTSNQQKNFGLDYTLSFLHESIPILSCYGEFATTPYHAWRTAFRESAKLSYFENITPSVEGSYRLKIWSTVAQGQHKEWVLKGAADGIKFFNLTNGDLTQLKQSFRWEWLRNYFISQYGNIE